MPQPSSPKRPGLLAWFGLLIVAVIAAVVSNMFFSGPTPSGMQVTTGSGSANIGALAYRQDASVTAEKYAVAPSAAPMPQAMPPVAGTPSAPNDAPAPLQRVIKTGELSLRVQDAQKAVTDARAIVASKNGFVESSSISDPGTGPRTAWMTLRVPADAFDAILADLKGKAVVVLNETTRGQDVTAEFVDIESDLRNAKAEEASYLEIMKRAGKIDEVLQVAQALANVRGRIEQLEGRKRYMTSQTDLATLNVTMTEETRIEVPGRTWKPLEVLRQAVQDLVASLQGLVDFLIRFVIAVVGLLLPILLISSFIIWVLWKIYRAVAKRINR